MAHHHHVCPVWVGYLLASPIRKLFQNPKKILAPYIEEGMNVLDVGCAMGFFSLPLAVMLGPNGKVHSVDLQEKMIRSLEKRARKKGLLDRIESRVCGEDSLGLEDLSGKIDFALAFAVVHEVPDAKTIFSEIFQALKPGGNLLVVEPKGHVSEEDFERSVSIAGREGFSAIDGPVIRRSWSVLLAKQ